MTRRKQTSRPRIARRLRAIATDKRLIAAVIAAVGVTAALGTFAAGGKPSGSNTVWQASGADTAKCAPKHKKKNPCVKQGGTVTAKGRFKTEYKVSGLKNGRYKMRVVYRTSGARTGDHRLVISRNGRKVEGVRVPPSLDNYTHISRDFTVKGNARFSVDINPSTGSQVTIDRVALKEVKDNDPADLSDTDLAKRVRQLVGEGKITIQSSSNGNANDAFKAVAEGKCAPVPSTGGCVHVDKGILVTLVEAAEKYRFTITAFTDGRHSTNSEHYHGRAIDFAVNPHAGGIRDIARQNGARWWGGAVPNPNFSDVPNHFHLGWGSGP